MGMYNALIWLRTGTVVGSCEHGYEPPGSIKLGEFANLLITSPPNKLCFKESL
jgi:hypothetical protein